MNRISPSYESAMRAPIHPEEIASQRQVDERWTRTTAYHGCRADACQQGRKPCPCPSACEVAESEGPGMFSSPEFWIYGASCALCWTALAGLLLGWW